MHENKNLGSTPNDLDPRIYQELERLGGKYHPGQTLRKELMSYKGKVDNYLLPASLQKLSTFYLGKVYFDIWEEFELRLLEHAYYAVNETSYSSNEDDAPIFHFLFSSITQYYYSIRADDPNPSNPFVFYVDHDWHDWEDNFGQASELPSEKNAAGNLLELFQDLDTEVRAKLCNTYYMDYLDLPASPEECIAYIEALQPKIKTTCEEMSYALFLAEAYARLGDLKMAKLTYTKFEKLQKYPLRVGEQETLNTIKKILF